MKKVIIFLMISLAILTVSGCSKKQTTDSIKKDIQQIVKDVYSPKTMKQFRDSYKKYTEDSLLTKDAADSFYVLNGSKLTEEDLARSCYVDTYYSNKDSNSEGKAHYLAKIQVHGGDDTITYADIFFYVKEGTDESKETIIDNIVAANVKVGN